jgi:hypothetical protein
LILEIALHNIELGLEQALHFLGIAHQETRAVPLLQHSRNKMPTDEPGGSCD